MRFFHFLVPSADKFVVLHLECFHPALPILGLQLQNWKQKFKQRRRSLLGIELVALDEIVQDKIISIKIIWERLRKVRAELCCNTEANTVTPASVKRLSLRLRGQRSVVLQESCQGISKFIAKKIRREIQISDERVVLQL